MIDIRMSALRLLKRIKHVARLRRLGQNFQGEIVIGKRTQLTIAITGCATILRMGYTTMRRAEIFWFVLPLVTFWGYIMILVANCQINLLEARRQFGAITHVLHPSYMCA